MTPLYQWQIGAVDLSKRLPNIALFCEMGCGKSRATIEILRSKYTANKRLMKTLIIAPPIVLYNWKNEILKYSKIREDQIIVLDKTGAAVKKQFMDQVYDAPTNTFLPKIIITNYDKFQNEDILSLFLSYVPEILIADESHKLKNHQSKRAKNIVKISDLCSHKYILTGTPILNSPMDVFFQYRVLDGGQTFGKNFFVFRSKFFEDLNASWSSKAAHFPKYEIRAETYGELSRLMYSKAIRVTKDEVLDLPPLVIENVPVALGKEQARMYKELERDFITYVKELKTSDKSAAIVARLAITKALRLQQLLTGVCATEDGSEILLSDNPRLDRLEELLLELTPNHKNIVWTCFKYNYKQISRVCEKYKIKYVMLTGEQTALEKHKAAEAFNTDPSIRVIIANRSAGGVGISLTAASYSISYSRNFSLGDEIQSESRNHRKGSEIHERIVKINLIAEGTIDRIVLDALENKQNVANAILEYGETK